MLYVVEISFWNAVCTFFKRHGLSFVKPGTRFGAVRRGTLVRSTPKKVGKPSWCIKAFILHLAVKSRFVSVSWKCDLMLLLLFASH